MAKQAKLTVGLFICATFVCNVAHAQRFRPAERDACINRLVDYSGFGKRYHFSWLHPDGAGRTRHFTWASARNYCRRFCMDAVTIDSAREYRAVQQIIRQDGLSYIWTSGRKCNFLPACGRVDLQPAIINGWFWASSGVRLPPPDECQVCDWSDKGGLNQSQPDNREFRTKFGGEEEACIAILNNFYDDGIRWHDVGCSHRKPVICQEQPELLESVGLANDGRGE